MLSPSNHLRSLSSAIKALPQSPRPDLHDNSRILKDERLEAYTMDVVEAVRRCDIDRLRELWAQGHCLNACNSNGESLLHLACRRCDAATVQFLVQEAGVNVNVRDRMGRTVLHDICWRPTPEHNVMDIVLRAIAPELLLAVDARGHSCWDYCRQSDWESWNDYLTGRRALIVQRVSMNLCQSDESLTNDQSISVH